MFFPSHDDTAVSQNHAIKVVYADVYVFLDALNLNQT